MPTEVLPNDLPLTNTVNPELINSGLSRLEAALFPVASTKLQYTVQEANDEVTMDILLSDTNYQVIYRADTNRVVGVHTKAYNLVPNKDLFIPLLSALFSSGIDTTGMTSNVELPAEGGQTIVTFRFPNERVIIGENDELEMTITVVNSYNGAWAFRADLGAYRLICSNGARIGGKMLDIYARHTSGLDIDKAVHALSDALVTFKENEVIWKQWALHQVSVDQARVCLEKAVFLSEKSVEDVMNRFIRESERLGRHSVWSLYNALTEWATHAETRSKGANGEAIKYKRQEQVFRFTESKYWVTNADGFSVTDEKN